MDTQALTAFLTVAETASFSMAAEQLCITQPAISKRIATLESQLNLKLFDRFARRVQLTEAGRILLPKAKEILQKISDTHKLMANFSDTISGRLPLATSHHIGLHYLPHILKTFRSQYPDVSLEIKFLESEAAHQALYNSEIELAFATLPQTPSKELISKTLWQDELAFVCSRGSPTLNSLSTLAELSHHNAILPNANTLLFQQVEVLFKNYGLTLDTSMETNYLETIKVMVAADLGWSVLPQSMIDSSIEPIHLSGITLKRHLGVMFHKERTLSNAAQRLLAGLIN